MRKSIVYCIRIFLPLLIICACVAALVSGINLLTAEKIAGNEAGVARAVEERKLKTIADIYGDGVTFTVLEDIPDTVDEIRSAESDSGTLYCVTVTSYGYSREGIQLFVAFDGGLKVRRVIVLSSGETPNVGTKVNDEAYLAQYIGLTGGIVLGNGVDKIATATLSSRAVADGVNAAYAAILSIGA